MDTLKAGSAPIFDRLGRWAEKGDPDLLAGLNRARLFVFPGVGKEILPRNLTDSEKTRLRDDFFLPFVVTAIEDLLSVVILIDWKDQGRGMAEKRTFIHCMPDDVPLQRKSPSEFPPGSLHLSAGRIVGGTVSFDSPAFTPLSLRCKLTRFATAIPPGGIETIRLNDVSAEAWKMEISAVQVAFMEMFYFNNPERFVIESTPTKHHQVAAGRFRRTSHRSLYTAVTPKQIHQSLGLGNDPGKGHASPHPHLRRRHFRTYRSERYTRMKGKTVIIPPIWVGPKEKVLAHRRYRVCLEL